MPAPVRLTQMTHGETRNAKVRCALVITSFRLGDLW